MATLEQFKEVRASVSPEVQNELYALVIQDPDAAVQRMIGIASENGASFTADEVRTYLEEMDADDEFDDVELDEATMSAVSGGGSGWCGRRSEPTARGKANKTVPNSISHPGWKPVQRGNIDRAKRAKQIAKWDQGG